MWALRVLNGPMAGQFYVLKMGRNRVGRASGVEFQVNVPGISKEHLEIQVFPDKVLITDLRSSNGTFLNGVRIQNGTLRLGDKISLDKVLFDLVMAQGLQPQSMLPARQGTGLYPVPNQQTGMTSASTSVQTMVRDFEPNMPQAPAPSGISSKAQSYLNDVILPGVYRLPEVFEFRVVIMGFAIIFIFMVTLLSLIPMNQITSESIKTESRRRALTVARALANANEKAIRSGEMSGYSADLVLKDEGISNVYILAKDGSVMAPPEMAGMSPKAEMAGFAAQIKGQTRELSAEIGGGKIGASVPILVFDPELQQNVAKAHAVVVYDTEGLKFDDGRTLSLFVQMLAIALAIGVALFFLMYKLIEHPFRRLNEELDNALREGKDHAIVNMKFPVLQSVLVNINSLLTRVQQGGGSSPTSSAQMSHQEWMNLTEMVGFPALLLSKEMVVVAVNTAFESLTGMNAVAVQNQTLQQLPDQAMQKNIQELISEANSSTQQVQRDRLEIGGVVFSLQCQAVTVGGDAKYFLITVSPLEQAEGGAA